MSKFSPQERGSEQIMGHGVDFPVPSERVGDTVEVLRIVAH